MDSPFPGGCGFSVEFLTRLGVLLAHIAHPLASLDDPLPQLVQPLLKSDVDFIASSFDVAPRAVRINIPHG